MAGIKIEGAGLYVPERIITNDDLAKLVDTNDEWISSRTGISKRHASCGEPTWYLGTQAAKAALKNSGVLPEQLGLIIVSTVTADFFTPSIACLIQRELGAAHCMSLDVNAACSGFVYALEAARALMMADEYKKYALIVSSETLTRYVDYTDRSTCILFGDGAAAAVISLSEGMYSSFLGADGNGAQYLFSRSIAQTNVFYDGKTVIDDKMGESKAHFFYQDGHEVYKFAVKAMPNAVERACEKAGISVSDIDLIIPHQANIRIIKTAVKALGIPDDKVFVNIERYGNTSSATIPIALSEAIEQGRLRRGDKVCLVGFGAGLTYGAAIFEY